MIELNDTTFSQPVNGNNASIVTFTSPNCSGCKGVKQLLEHFESTHPIPVYLVDVEDSPRLAMRHHVRSLPTTVLFDMGVELDRIVGTFNSNRLENWLNLIHGETP